MAHLLKLKHGIKLADNYPVTTGQAEEILKRLL
jgi:hypothetical protein